MRKGTFSVQTANPNSSKHNSRELAPKYLIDSSAKNHYELITPDDDFKNIAQEIYKEKIKQTMQKKQVDSLVQETVLTLRPEQNENDVKELFKELNKKYGGHELLELAIHRDEGYFLKDDIAYYPTKNILKKDDDWYVCSDTSISKPKVTDFDTKVNIDEFEKVYNYHAHAKFSMFDRETGKTARMQKKDMSSRIKFVSEHLKLEYNPSADRHIKKSVNQIKDEHLAKARTMENNKSLEKELLATKEQLKTANNQLRTFMKENQAVRTDYAPLEAEKKILEEKLKAKELTEKELLTKFQTLEKNFISSKSLVNELKTEKEVLSSKVTTLEEKIVSSSNMSHPHTPKDIQEEFQKIKNEELEEKEVKTGLFSSEKIKVLKPDSNILQRTWNLVSSKYEDLKAKYNDLVVKFNILQKENFDLKEKVRELSTKQQNQTRTKDHLEAIVEKFEANQGKKSDSSILEKIKDVQKEEESSKKKKNYLSR